MTKEQMKEQAIEKMLKMRGLVLVSFESKKWVALDHVAKYVDVKILEVLEAYDLIEVRIGHTKATSFRVKANGYKLALKYR